MAERIQQELRQMQILHAQSTISEFVTLSIGIATTVPAAPVAPYTLLDEVDRHLYLAKQQGRNRVV